VEERNMATITQHAPGTFCWPELATSDQAGAKKFYTSLFGWAVSESPMGEGETYTILQKGDQSVGALYTMRPEEAKQGVPPHWNAYVSVADVDKSTAQAKQLGGKVMMDPFEVMEHGRMSVIQDPTGAVFCLWQPKNHIGAGVLNETGALVWTELMTPDTDKASKFYTSLFGWKTETMPNPLMTYTIFKRGEDSAGGMLTTPKEAAAANVPPHWLGYFGVENADKAIAKAKDLGAKVYMGPTDIPNMGRFAILADPQGAAFAVWESKM